MGCWNKTCGLSNLPIFAGDATYVFVLEKNMNNRDRCYSTAFWRPVLLPFVSEYDDYGSGENSSGVGFPILMEVLKNQIIEMEVGDNEYHDIPVNREKFGETMFFEAVRENRLFLRDRYNNGQIPVDYVMFRKDFVDYILDNNAVELYVGQKRSDTNYISVKFDDIVADIDAYLDRIIKEISDLKVKKPGCSPYVLTRSLKLWNDINSTLVDEFILVEAHNISTIFYFGDSFIRMISSEEFSRENVRAFLVDYLKGCYLNYFMESTRKTWNPGGYEGSQSGINSEYEVLLAATKNVIENIKKEFEEEIE